MALKEIGELIKYAICHYISISKILMWVLINFEEDTFAELWKKVAQNSSFLQEGNHVKLTAVSSEAKCD